MHPFNTHHQESVSDLTWDEFLEDSPIDLSPSIEDLIKNYELSFSMENQSSMTKCISGG